MQRLTTPRWYPYAISVLMGLVVAAAFLESPTSSIVMAACVIAMGLITSAVERSMGARSVAPVGRRAWLVLVLTGVVELALWMFSFHFAQAGAADWWLFPLGLAGVVVTYASWVAYTAAFNRDVAQLQRGSGEEER